MGYFIGLIVGCVCGIGLYRVASVLLAVARIEEEKDEERR